MKEIYVTVRYTAVPEHLLPREQQRAPCEGCAFVSPAPLCSVMSARMVAYGLPDCEKGFVYREEGR